METIPKDDLTCILYTAGVIPEYFARHTREQLLKAIDDLPLIVVSKQPLDLGYNSQNIVVTTPRSHVNIYRDALTGAKAAQTKYIALAEDDVLYSPEHFRHRSSPGKFAYNLAAWSIFTWNDPPMFSHKGKVRKNLNSLICERELFIEAMEERFARYPDETKISNKLWAEPGKYERQLGVTIRETEDFYANPPNIVFSHETELSYEGLGTKKRIGEFRAFSIPYWHNAEYIRKMYGGLSV